MSVSTKKQSRHIAKPAVIWIIFGVIKGYVINPIPVILSTLLKLIKIKRKYRVEYPSEFLTSAGFLFALFRTLETAEGRDRAFEICRIAALSSGIAVQSAHFQTVEAGRSFSKLIREHQQTFKAGSTSLNETEVQEISENQYKFSVTKCAFYEFFTKLGEPDLTALFCAVDNGIFNAYLPGELIFNRGGLRNTLVEGAKKCTFIISRKSDL